MASPKKKRFLRSLGIPGVRGSHPLEEAAPEPAPEPVPVVKPVKPAPKAVVKPVPVPKALPKTIAIPRPKVKKKD
jgi:hypothetical protein